MKDYLLLKLLSAMALLALLTACVSVGGGVGVGSGGGGVGVAASVPVGQGDSGLADVRELLLTRDLEIPAGWARAFFQDGRQTSGKDRYRPHCEFEVSNVSDGTETVRADRFVITGITQRMMMDEDSGVPVFMPNMFGSQDIFYETRMKLASRHQPGVRELICRDWSQDFGRGWYLSLGQMQAVLGDHFVFR